MSIVVHERDLRTGRSRIATFDGESYTSGVTLLQVDSEPGQGAETWMVLSGEAVITIGGEEIQARAGDVVIAGAGMPHRFRNPEGKRLEIMRIFTSWRETAWQDDSSKAAA